MKTRVAPFGRPAVIGVLLLVGCHSVARRPLPPEGASAFQFVERPTAPAAGAPALSGEGAREPVDVLLKAEPLVPLAAPVYPRGWLGRLALPVNVGVRITVDGTGRVAHVGASLVAFSSGGEPAEDFRAAVEAALAQWRFRPAERRHLVPRAGGPGQAGYWQVTRAQPTEDAFDVVFTFSAKGEVTSAGYR